MNTLLRRLNPTVPRRSLIPIAAFIWGGVGVMLMVRSGIWLSGFGTVAALVSVGVGLFFHQQMIMMGPQMSTNSTIERRRSERM